MAYSEAQKRATMEYMKKLEEIRFRVKEGERTLLQAEAKAKGLSVTQHLIQAVNEKTGHQVLTPANDED